MVETQRVVGIVMDSFFSFDSVYSKNQNENLLFCATNRRLLRKRED